MIGIQQRDVQAWLKTERKVPLDQWGDLKRLNAEERQAKMEEFEHGDDKNYQIFAQMRMTRSDEQPSDEVMKNRLLRVLESMKLATIKTANFGE